MAGGRFNFDLLGDFVLLADGEKRKVRERGARGGLLAASTPRPSAAVASHCVFSARAVIDHLRHFASQGRGQWQASRVLRCLRIRTCWCARGGVDLRRTSCRLTQNLCAAPRVASEEMKKMRWSWWR